MGFVKIAQHEFHNCLHYYRKERLNSIEMGYLPFTCIPLKPLFSRHKGIGVQFTDEPTGNLDSRTGEEIMRLFHELHDQGNTIVLITHDENVALQAERRIAIFDGHVREVAE